MTTPPICTQHEKLELLEHRTDRTLTERRFTCARYAIMTRIQIVTAEPHCNQHWQRLRRDLETLYAIAPSTTL